MILVLLAYSEVLQQTVTTDMITTTAKSGWFVAIASIVLMLGLSTMILYSSPSKASVVPSENRSRAPHVKMMPVVLIDHTQEEVWKILCRSLDQYRMESTKAIQSLGRSLEVALYYESSLELDISSRLSQKLERRIEKLSACFDHDFDLLGKLVVPFEAVRALPSESSSENEDQKFKRKDANKNKIDQSDYLRPPSTIFQVVHGNSNVKAKNPHHTRSATTTENAYDAMAQVIAHIARDWSPLGKNIRENIYQWCVDQVQVHVPMRKEKKILVPGAGLGRLAFDIANKGYVTEANEISPVMVAAACAILQRNEAGVLHPFAMDFMNNEVESNRRYDGVHFSTSDDGGLNEDSIPSSPKEKTDEGRLSYTVGDFSYYETKTHHNSFDSVVTCFFIDTAPNIYDYLNVIANVLPRGGVWVNLGPLQWHRDSILYPSVDELKDLIVAFGFRIISWKIDSEPVSYRDDGYMGGDPSFIRTTNFDAYRPLRFVAIKN